MAALERDLPPLSEVEYNPQPGLSDLVFDGDDMVLGLRDRYGDQIGRDAGTLDPTYFSTLILGVGVGDILRPAAAAAGSPSSRTARCGGVTTAGGVGTGDGPGGGEYYFTDSMTAVPEVTSGTSTWTFRWAPGPAARLPDVTATSTGDARASSPAASASTSTPPGWSTGPHHLRLAAGHADRSLRQGQRARRPRAPVRRRADRDRQPHLVDANRNGIQDPGEAGIPGVTVSLGQGGTLVGRRHRRQRRLLLRRTTNQNLFAPNRLLPSSAYALALDNPPTTPGRSSTWR